MWDPSWSPLPLFIPSKLTFPHSSFGVIGLFLAEKPCQVTRANLSLPFTNGTWFMVISFSQLFTSKESICYKAPSKALLRMQQSERRPLGLFQELRLCSVSLPFILLTFCFLKPASSCLPVLSGGEMQGEECVLPLSCCFSADVEFPLVPIAPHLWHSEPWPYAQYLPDLHRRFSRLLILVFSFHPTEDLQDKLSKRDKEVSSLVSQTEALRAQVSGKFP